MLIQLKNVRINNRISEETTCFSASLWIDGKKAADVMNRGCGGDNEYHFADRALQTRFEAFCAAMPPVPCKYGDGSPLPMDAEFYISMLLERFEREKLCKGKTLFRTKGMVAGEYRQIKSPFSPEVKAFLVKKFGDDLESILNEDVLDELVSACQN